MKRTLPLLGWISILVFSGAQTACDDDDDSRFVRVARAYCSKFEECDPGYFYEIFNSVNGCVDSVVISYRGLIAEFGVACGDAQLAYGDCMSRQPCEEPENACYAEDMAATEACKGEVTSPCPGYVAGSDEDYCCQTHNPCDWAVDEWCDCSGTCSWDAVDCS